METLNVVITEILLCLALAWALGFLAAWILFRKVQNEYEQELEELEENLLYVSSANKNQEREITMQNMKIQELEKSSGKDIKSTNKKDKKQEKTQNKSTKKESIQKNENSKKKTSSKDEEMLRLIDNNLYVPKKK